MNLFTKPLTAVTATLDSTVSIELIENFHHKFQVKSSCRCNLCNKHLARSIHKSLLIKLDSFSSALSVALQESVKSEAEILVLTVVPQIDHISFLTSTIFISSVKTPTTWQALRRDHLQVTTKRKKKQIVKTHKEKEGRINLVVSSLSICLINC